MMIMRMKLVVILWRISVSTLAKQLIHCCGEPGVRHPRRHPVGGSPLVPGHITILVTRAVAVGLLVVLQDHAGEQVGEVQLLLLVGNEGTGEGVGVLGKSVGWATRGLLGLLFLTLLPPWRCPGDFVSLS